MNSTTHFTRTGLRGGSALRALALMGAGLTLGAGFVAPAFAQDAATAPTTAAPTTAQDDTQSADATPDIVVTGTLFRRTNTETPSPVTVLTADNLAKRGVSTVTEAVSQLSSNGAGNLPNGFSAAGGAFANGAAAVSLRGLTTDSTLVLFDGLRATYYPLSDDGTRNFVDLNTIPDAIVDRVEVLKDGASSTYGADAVAGVVNVIVKKEIQGFQGTVEAGVSQRGDGGSQRLTATYGHGDLEKDGYNFYINGEYQRDQPIFLRDRGYPFNSGDLSRITGTDADGNTVCGVNANPNGLNCVGAPAGAVGQTIVPIVRAANPDGSFIDGSQYQLLNPAAGCGRLTQHDIAGVGTVCEQDLVKDYQQAQGLTTRFGTTAHVTAQLNDDTQAYAMFTYYQDKVTHTSGGVAGIRNQTNTGDYNTLNIVLPAVLTAGPNAGELNPNDPFAPQGQDARIFYRFGDIPNYVTSLSRSYRGAAGIDGKFGDGFNYSVHGTYMKTDLKTSQYGYIYIQGLLDVIADGSYNFADPSQNSANVRNTVSPVNRSTASSSLWQIDANISKDLFDLPGGPLQVAVGGSVRHEELNDPSANPDDMNNPTDQYYTINAFGAIGQRYVESGYFEINAPILDPLEVNLTGRYDHYSSGFDHFSPKIGVKFTPIKQIALRGTFSKGFRVPSFAESNSLPTIGFSNFDTDIFTDAFIQQHLVDKTTGAPVAAGSPNSKADAYASSYLIGLNTSGTPGLKPEKSTSFTGGVVVQPTHWLSMTVDYFHIKKTNVIVGADPTGAELAYYQGQPIPEGFTITQDAPDDLHPDADRRIFAVNYGFVNADKIVTDGIDAEASINLPLGNNVKFQSLFSGTYVLNFNQTTADGDVQHYAGSLGPCNITSCSGSPKFRANWQNTIDIDQFSLSATAYYTSRYKTTAEDVAGSGTIDDCSTASVDFDDGVTPIQCHVKRFIDVDLNAAIRVNDQFTFYANIYNVLDTKPSEDLVTYGQNGYNPAWSQSGIIGRYFKVGANFSF